MFHGADTDQLRSASLRLREACDSLEASLRRLGAQANELNWTGPDADEFRRRAAMATLSAQVGLVSALRACGDDLRGHADLQDATSSTLDGASDVSGAGTRHRPLDLSNVAVGALGGSHNVGIDRFMQGGGGFDGPSVDLSWERSGDVAAYRLDRSGQTHLGDLAVAGSAGLALLSARAGTSAALHAGLDGVSANVGANAGAYLVDAHAQGTATYGPLTANGSARAMVGAEANASANVALGKDGLKAGAEAGAIAGAQASANASIDVAGVGAGARATAIAGAAAKASADVSVSATQVKAHVEVAAALGFGAGVSFDVNVQPAKIMKEISSWQLW